MGIGYRKRFSVLFKKFRDLSYINVSGVEYTKDNPDIASEDSMLLPKGGLLDIFRDKTPQQQVNKGNGWMDKVWDSKPVKVLTNAFGWTIGTQAVFMAASMFGPVGLLFGAFAIDKELKGSGSRKQ